MTDYDLLKRIDDKFGEDFNRHNEALKEFMKILSIAPNSLKSNLSGKELAEEIVKGAKFIENHPDPKLTADVLEIAANSLKQNLSGEELVKDFFEASEVILNYVFDGKPN